MSDLNGRGLEAESYERGRARVREINAAEEERRQLSRVMVCDTETTGVLNFRLPVDHPTQPRLVQFGAQMFDADRRVAAEINVLVRPDGFEIPAEATAVHGITTEHAMAHGLPLVDVLLLIQSILAVQTLLVCHNKAYDLRVVAGEFQRKRLNCLSDGTYPMDRYPSFCTMEAMTPLCKLPPRFPGTQYKWPKLEEGYGYAFNEKLEKAHDAMWDVRAAARLFWWLKDRDEAQRRERLL